MPMLEKDTFAGEEYLDAQLHTETKNTHSDNKLFKAITPIRVKIQSRKSQVRINRVRTKSAADLTFVDPSQVNWE